MPVGQFVGSKKKYIYVTDLGDNYIITRDETLATVAGTGLVELDPEAPPAGSQPAPRGFSFRGVYWQADEGTEVEGARKFLICGTTAATLYASSSSQAVPVDGFDGTTTGRKGESQSFI